MYQYVGGSLLSASTQPLPPFHGAGALSLRLIQVNISPMADKPKTPKNPSDEHVSLTRNERIAIVFFFIVALLYTGWHYFSNRNVEVDLGKDTPGGIVVDVEGAVNSPGNVYLPPMSTIQDAVDAAGGFTENADRSGINLVERVIDGQRITVPEMTEPEPRPSNGGSNIIGIRSRIIDEPYSGIRRNSGNSPSDSGTHIVNINTANIYELEELPGIGEVLAQKIIDYRNAHGKFERIEDIMNVDGIGETRFDEIRNYIAVEDR